MEGVTLVEVIVAFAAVIGLAAVLAAIFRAPDTALSRSIDENDASRSGRALDQAFARPRNESELL